MQLRAEKKYFGKIQLVTYICSLMVETVNRQFVKHLPCMILYSQEILLADDFTTAEDFVHNL